MTRNNKTNSERRKLLFARISPEHLFSNTAVFSGSPGIVLDAATVEHIKTQFRIYFDSWVRDDAKKFILNDKNIK